MRLHKTAILAAAALLLTHLHPARAQQAATTVIVPQGTMVPLNLVNPIKHKSTKPGDTVRAQVAFPITVGDQIAIPAGTAVEGTIAAKAKGKKPANAPPITIHFTRLIYANGYSVSLDATNTAKLMPIVLPQMAAGSEIAQLELPHVHGPSPAPDPDPVPAPEPQYPTPPTVTDPYAHDGPTTKELVAFTVGPIAFIGALVALVHFARPHGDYMVEPAGWQFQMTLQNAFPVDVARVNAAASTATP